MSGTAFARELSTGMGVDASVGMDLGAAVDGLIPCTDRARATVARGHAC